MNQQLLTLFRNHPAISAKGDEFVCALAEDVQAVIIRALDFTGADQQLAQLENDVQDLYVDDFGVQLANLLFFHYAIAGNDQTRVTKAMLQTFMLEHGQGALLKKRLQSLAAVV